MATANHDVIGTEEAIAAEEFTRGYRAWMLFILLLMNALNLADRQGLAAVAPAHGVQFAMAAVAGLLLWGSVHYLLAARTLRADLDARYRARPADVVA